jgi:hypothetical protein
MTVIGMLLYEDSYIKLSAKKKKMYTLHNHGAKRNLNQLINILGGKHSSFNKFIFLQLLIGLASLTKSNIHIALLYNF